MAIPQSPLPSDSEESGPETTLLRASGPIPTPSTHATARAAARHRVTPRLGGLSTRLSTSSTETETSVGTRGRTSTPATAGQPMRQSKTPSTVSASGGVASSLQAPPPSLASPPPSRGITDGPAQGTPDGSPESVPAAPTAGAARPPGLKLPPARRESSHHFSGTLEQLPQAPETSRVTTRIDYLTRVRAGPETARPALSSSSSPGGATSTTKYPATSRMGRTVARVPVRLTPLALALPDSVSVPPPAILPYSPNRPLHDRGAHRSPGPASPGLDVPPPHPNMNGVDDGLTPRTARLRSASPRGGAAEGSGGPSGDGGGEPGGGGGGPDGPDGGGLLVTGRPRSGSPGGTPSRAGPETASAGGSPPPAPSAGAAVGMAPTSTAADGRDADPGGGGAGQTGPREGASEALGRSASRLELLIPPPHGGTPGAPAPPPVSPHSPGLGLPGGPAAGCRELGPEESAALMMAELMLFEGRRLVRIRERREELALAHRRLLLQLANAPACLPNARVIVIAPPLLAAAHADRLLGMGWLPVGPVGTPPHPSGPLAAPTTPLQGWVGLPQAAPALAIRPPVTSLPRGASQAGRAPRTRPAASVSPALALALAGRAATRPAG
ncbi:hypothetical protein PAPYR_3644 [Paratrimastix pyriformis]|uniref:Uncharacterized protein n=1 Tax=Paratrimastix pyriformis TaxID=342808 RepID=A0ABQ8USC2_9EUKA|nr:hypothetical protein PAPYR_3644 [Paratrimastix pyriformis]